MHPSLDPPGMQCNQRVRQSGETQNGSPMSPNGTTETSRCATWNSACGALSGRGAEIPEGGTRRTGQARHPPCRQQVCLRSDLLSHETSWTAGLETQQG